MNKRQVNTIEVLGEDTKKLDFSSKIWYTKKVVRKNTLNGGEILKFYFKKKYDKV